MAQRTEDILHDIAPTRAAMKEKLTLVEERVRETATGVHGSVEKIGEDVGEIVEDVQATVDTTLVAVRQGVAGTHAAVGAMGEQVKGTIGETVATVKRTVDLPSQTAHHPWPMVGGAVLVGSMLGRWGSGPRPAAGPTAERATEAANAGSPPASHASSARPQPQQGLVSDMLHSTRQ